MAISLFRLEYFYIKQLTKTKLFRFAENMHVITPNADKYLIGIGWLTVVEFKNSVRVRISWKCICRCSERLSQRFSSGYYSCLSVQYHILLRWWGIWNDKFLKICFRFRLRLGTWKNHKHFTLFRSDSCSGSWQGTFSGCHWFLIVAFEFSKNEI